MPLPTYDGLASRACVAPGIERVEAVGDRCRLSWREQTDPVQVAYQVACTGDSMAALFTAGRINVWQRALPSTTLRTRAVVEPAEDMALPPAKLPARRRGPGWQHPTGTLPAETA
ncbi:hypothetical protein JCM18899A_10230 [Nocardioides sp. AN3]